MSELIADELRADPRIEEAKKLILEAIGEHQQKLHTAKAPDETKKVSYQELLKAYEQVRPGALWYPYLGSGIGKGPLVELADGSVKYDFISGIGVHCMGHNHPSMTEVSIDSALDDIIIQGHLQQNCEAYELSQLLVDSSGMDRCFLSSSGAMANENAWKLIFQKRYPANRMLAFERCFMGRTLALSQVTDKPAGRIGLPPTLIVDYLPCYDAKDPEGSTERCMHRLETFLNRYPGQYAGLSLELIQGEGGFYAAPRSFYVRLFELLKSHDVAIHVDEIQSFGRTTELYAYQHFDLAEYVDVVSIGKLSLTCATLYREAFNPKPGTLSQTFTSSSSLIRGSLVVLRHLIDGNYYGSEGKNAAFNAYFCRKFEEINGRCPGAIHGPHGVGTMVAFTPFDGDNKRTLALSHELFEEGLICFICGSSPMRIRFLLPMCALTYEDIDGALEILECSLQRQRASIAATQ